MSVVIPSDFFRFRSFPSTSVSCCRHHRRFRCFGPPYPAGRMTHPLRKCACLADRTFAVQVFPACTPCRPILSLASCMPHNQVVCTIRLSVSPECSCRETSWRLCAALDGSWRSRPGCGSPDVGDVVPRYVPVALSRSASGALSRPASVLRLYGMTGGVENRLLWPSISPKRWSNHSERAQSIFSGIVIVVWKRGFPISVCDARMNSHIRATMSG